ncbi:hypothetical protein [Paraburkholderia sartisoli]|uniref:Uncharacterized protein n=1 Tax=Paraburkholderia sartisoli TaxID=83784 RepID=A0A1H4CMK9_9BURK|nr:hypothetical protein [Paraburkholderia sartisoli]SEA61553.1 hypothetical protein SAMN05192564_102383 [Paraburkholderia sartisoli]
MLNTQYQTFKTATDKRHTVFTARGNNIREVDTALRAYWTEMNGAANATREIACLNNIVIACKDWLKLKQGKSETRTTTFTRTEEVRTLFIARRTAITNLGTEALRELYTRLQALGILTADLRGRIHFDSHKLAVLGSGRHVGARAPNVKPLKPMGADYQNERISYLMSNKTQAISGSGVHGTHEFINKGLATNQDIELPRDPLRRQEALAVAAKDVHTLTMEDFQILDEIGRQNFVSGDVNYLNKSERLQYIAIVGADGTLYDCHDQKITAGAVTAYAMDNYGTLYTKDATPLGGATFFNHSSFNAGKDVISAGTLIIKDGALRVIDNNSGHYKPTRDNLHNCLQVLESEGLNLQWTTVNLYVWVAGVKQEHRYYAREFLRDPNGRPFRIT